MDFDDISQWLSGQQAPGVPLTKVFSQYVTAPEAVRIFGQFQSKWIPNGQVLWSGIPFDKAQAWAKKNNLQTLTTAMGPLMDKRNPECPRIGKSKNQWSRYIHGASAIFAWHIARFEKVILLSSPPPQRLHPTGLSNYQSIEEPIIQGLLGHCAVQKIINIHSTVPGGEQCPYEIWPHDETFKWTKQFGMKYTSKRWRSVGNSGDKLRLKDLITQSEQRILSKRTTEGSERSKVSPDSLPPPILWFILLVILARFAVLSSACIIFTVINRTLRQENGASKRCQLRPDSDDTGGSVLTMRSGRKISSGIHQRNKVNFDKSARDTTQKKAQKKRTAEEIQPRAQEGAQKKRKAKKLQAKAQEGAQKKPSAKGESRTKVQKNALKKRKAKKKLRTKAQERDQKKPNAKKNTGSKRKRKPKKCKAKNIETEAQTEAHRRV